MSARTAQPPADETVKLPPSLSQGDEGRALASAVGLLEEARYSEAAEVVLGLERECDRAGETVAAGVLGLAYELCLACRDHHSEAENHRRSLDVASRLERRLRERLASMLGRATPRAARSNRPMGRPSRRGRRRTSGPSLAVHCLGPLLVYREGARVEAWPNRRAKAVFKYLVLNQASPKEVLMELFWPDASPAAARNNLNVAVYMLRRALRAEEHDFSYVLYRDDSYLLNPELQLWVDLAEFERRAASAAQLESDNDLPAALADLEAAEALYQGSLFEDDPYEEWIIPRRRELEDRYLRVLDRLRGHYLARGDIAACTAVCQRMLIADGCREDAHAELMRCYARQGQHHLALRQFDDCREALEQELDAGPSDELRALYERVRRREAV